MNEGAVDTTCLGLGSCGLDDKTGHSHFGKSSFGHRSKSLLCLMNWKPRAVTQLDRTIGVSQDFIQFFISLSALLNTKNKQTK